MKKSQLALMLVFSLSLTARADMALREIYENNQAVQRMREEDLAAASEILHNLVSSNPNSGIPKLNLSGLYASNQDLEGSKGLLEELVKSLKNPEASAGLNDSEKRFLLFAAHFNLAYINSLDKSKAKEAVENYAIALNYEPDDIATKLNIELLTKAQQGGSNSENQQDQKQEQQDQKDQKDQKNQEQKKSDNPNYKDQKKQQKPQFKENDLKKQDVRRIFQELKRQEEKIRAKMNKKDQDEPENDKDW